MRYIRLEEIGMLQMQMFITAGKERNYHKTATLYNTTRDAVSKSISQLEKTLDMQLVYWQSGQMELTPAGQEIYQLFRTTVSQLLEGIQNAYDIQEGASRHLSIALPENTNPKQYMEPLTRLFTAQNPQTQLHFHVKKPAAALKELLNQKTDILFTLLHNQAQVNQYEALCSRVLLRCPLTAFMLRSNPLSQKQSLSIEDLQTQQLILPSQQKRPHYLFMIMNLFHQKGLVPLISMYADNEQEGILNLRRPDQVVLCDRFFLYNPDNELAAVDLSETEAGILMVWHQEQAASPLIQAFLDAADTCYPPEGTEV